jgi:hypothetical protein
LTEPVGGPFVQPAPAVTVAVYVIGELAGDVDGPATGAEIDTAQAASDVADAPPTPPNSAAAAATSAAARSMSTRLREAALFDVAADINKLRRWYCACRRSYNGWSSGLTRFIPGRATRSR